MLLVLFMICHLGGLYSVFLCYRYIEIIILCIMFSSMVIACPYCAGQSGENYIESIIIPVAGLLMAPFLLFGIMISVVYFHKDK